MPELPEIETLARGLRPQLVGRRLESIELLRASMLRTDPADLEQLTGAEITALRRAGKYLILDCRAAGGRHWQWMFHLGMTGQLLLRPAQAVPLPHTHLIVKLPSADLHFRDPRRFGRMALAPAPGDGGELAPELGVASGAEPLEISAAEFVALFHARKAPIKSALMNQKLLRGLGNIYADESLFRAGIAPRARSLSVPRLQRLRLAIRQVLRQAIAAGGSSISDYVDSRGEPGWFQLHHAVYGRTGQPCPRCGAAIRRVELSGRSSHYCPHCQKP